MSHANNGNGVSSIEVLDDDLIDITPDTHVLDGYHQDMKNCVCTKCKDIHSRLFSSSPRVTRLHRPIPVISNGNFESNPSVNFRDDAPLINAFNEDGGLANGDHVEFGTSVPDHCHSSKPHETKAKSAITKLVMACVLSTLFMISEIVGGYMANSIAIMSDAAHLLSDLTSFVVSLVAIYLAMRPASKKMNYGYQRAEVLGAVISVLIIWLVTGVLVYIAIERIISMDFEVEADTMIIVSGLAVLFNIVLGWVLHSGGHSHGGVSHGHSHGEGENINLRAAFIHVLGDFVQSIGVLISAYVIRYYPQYKIADPICTFIFSGIVMVTTFPILRDLSIVLMEGTPPGTDYNLICSNLAAIPGVKMVHSLHVWALTLDKNALSVHLAIDENSDSEPILTSAQHLIRNRHRIGHTTIQVERYQPLLMENCQQCQPLVS